MTKLIENHIEQFFKIQELLGSGAYGHVWRVVEKSSGKQYALKKIFDAFQNSIDAQRTYRQITVLNQLNHTNIVKLKAVIQSKNKKDLYLVFQYQEADLHALVGQKILQTPHLIYIMYQIFKALKYLHSAHLLHRDLKPSNILINAECQIKICDFGLVRSLTRQEDSQMILTEDVATRWYRSPEMLMGSKNYGSPTDVWSVGCIIAELLIGQPIFPGSSNVNQLQRIIEFTGIPSNQDIESLQIQYAQTLVNQLKIMKKPTKYYFKKCQPILVDLVIKMLQFNPNKRITVDQLLQHDIMIQIRQKREETICLKMILPELDDNQRLTVEQYQKVIYRDVKRRYPQYNKDQQEQQNTRYIRGHNSLKIVKKFESNSSTIGRIGSNSLFRPKQKLSSTWASNNNSSAMKMQKSAGKQLNCYLNPQKVTASQHMPLNTSSIHENASPFRRYKKYRQPQSISLQKKTQSEYKQKIKQNKFTSIMRNGNFQTIQQKRFKNHHHKSSQNRNKIQRKTFNRQKKSEVEQKKKKILYNKIQTKKKQIQSSQVGERTQTKEICLLQQSSEY